MNEKEILERFGISKNFGILLLIQSILVIIGCLFAINAVYEAISHGVNTLLLSRSVILLTYLSVLVYSFAGFKKGEIHYTSGVVLFLIYLLLFIVSNINIIFDVMLIIEIICLVIFLWKLNDYPKARILILLVVILEIIRACISLSFGVEWFVVVKTLILPCTMALTYEARYKRGLYSKK